MLVEGGGGIAGGTDNKGATTAVLATDAVGVNDMANGSNEPLDFSSACKFNKSAVWIADISDRAPLKWLPKASI